MNLRLKSGCTLTPILEGLINFAAETKKEPVTVNTYNPLSGETEKEAVVADMRLPIVRGIGKELSNGLWLYNAEHAEEVSEYLDHLTQEYSSNFLRVSAYEP